MMIDDSCDDDDDDSNDDDDDDDDDDDVGLSMMMMIIVMMMMLARIRLIVMMIIHGVDGGIRYLLFIRGGFHHLLIVGDIHAELRHVHLSDHSIPCAYHHKYVMRVYK